jgi:putative peptidoglycan binding protein
MKSKSQVLTALLLSAGVGLGAQSISAQSTAPGGGATGPNNPTQPRPNFPRETQPTIPSQPAPGIPQTDPIPGQPGTIPERIEPPRPSDRNMTVTSDDIKKAQEALQAKGHTTGTTGRLDAKTQQALRDFQKANNLPATGVLDEKTAEKLGVNKSGNAGSMPERRKSGASSQSGNSLQ